jgi:hypothetical protein
MPTVVNTIGSGAGRDYSTLAAWAASLPANLVADGNSYQGDCYNDSEFTGSATLLTLSGHTTDASHTITLTTGPGQSFQGQRQRADQCIDIQRLERSRDNLEHCLRLCYRCHRQQRRCFKSAD